MSTVELHKWVSIYVILISAISTVDTETRLVLPIENHGLHVNCQSILRANADRLISTDPAVTVGSLESTKLYDGELVIPYEPQCRRDRPDLFEPRQCNQYDCFCVNVTTGVVFLGTRASPSEVGNCSMITFSLLLAIRNPFYNPASKSDLAVTPYQEENRISPTQNSELTDRIRSSIERVLNSAIGFQRVTNVTKLFTVPKSKSFSDSTVGGLVYYRVQIISIGHSSLQAPQDLIQHRLHEGYFPDLGMVDPSISRMDIIQAKAADVGASLELPTFHKETVEPVTTGTSNAAVIQNSGSNLFAPVPVRSSSDKVERESRQLPGSDVSVPHISGGLVAPPIHESTSSIHKTWQARASRVNILRQPGVIAGIVGSVVVVLLLLVLLILFCIYRLRKKDEGSYALGEPKKTANPNSYHLAPTREFYA